MTASAARTGMGAAAVELIDVRKSFGKTEIIRGTSLKVMPGERVAIIGPNGAGKSTLFNLISGRFGPSSGEIRLNGQRIDQLKPYEINRLGLARSFQVSNLFVRLSVFENIRCAVLWSLGYRYTFWKFLADMKDANQRADEILQMIKLDLKRDVLATNLTYAEQRALEIGITIAGGAERGPARRADRRHEPQRDQPLHRTDPRGDGRQDAADGRARHGRRVRPGRQDRGAGLRRSDRLRRTRCGARRCARPGGLSRLAARRRDASRQPKARRRPHRPQGPERDAAIRRCPRLLRQEPYPARRHDGREGRARSSACSAATARAARPPSRRSWDWSTRAATSAGTTSS